MPSIHQVDTVKKKLAKVEPPDDMTIEIVVYGSGPLPEPFTQRNGTKVVYVRYEPPADQRKYCIEEGKIIWQKEEEPDDDQINE